MRHNRRTKRFNREYGERQAMLENLVTSLLTYQQIKTTLSKAKEAQRLAERVITLGKDNTVHARRRAFSYLQDRTLTTKLFKEVAPRFKDRKGGYTRILHLERRKGDGAQLALLELTEKEIKLKEPKKAKAKPEKAHGPHDGHDHGHAHDKGHAKPEGEAAAPKRPDAKQPKPKPGFFKNLGKFFRNKGGSA